MTVVPPAEEVVDTRAIADRLGVSIQRVHQWRSSTTLGFPEPIDELSGGRRIWLWVDVEDWARATGRLTT